MQDERRFVCLYNTSIVYNIVLRVCYKNNQAEIFTISQIESFGFLGHRGLQCSPSSETTSCKSSPKVLKRDANQDHLLVRSTRRHTDEAMLH